MLLLSFLLPLVLQINSEPVILAIGDSMTAGYGVQPDSSYPAQLQRELTKHGFSYRVINQGVTGSTTLQAFSRLNRALAVQPEVVIVQLGGNDAAQRISRDVSRETLRTIVTRFKSGGAKIYFAGGRFAHLDDVAREQNIEVIPFLDGVAGHPDLLLNDGVHPNSDGYAVVVRNIFNVIDPYLRAKAVSTRSINAKH
jgi:acyl-CoA thioesterase-1